MFGGPCKVSRSDEAVDRGFIFPAGRVVRIASSWPASALSPFVLRHC